MLNISGARFKQSRLEKETNKSIIVIVIFLLLLSFMAATYGALWDVFEKKGASFYLHFKKAKGDDAWDTLWPLILIADAGTWILILNNFVPISLITTMEIIRFWQAIFVSVDYEMVCENQGFQTKV